MERLLQPAVIRGRAAWLPSCPALLGVPGPAAAAPDGAWNAGGIPLSDAEDTVCPTELVQAIQSLVGAAGRALGAAVGWDGRAHARLDAQLAGLEVDQAEVPARVAEGVAGGVATARQQFLHSLWAACSLTNSPFNTATW